MREKSGEKEFITRDRKGKTKASSFSPTDDGLPPPFPTAETLLPSHRGALFHPFPFPQRSAHPPFSLPTDEAPPLSYSRQEPFVSMRPDLNT